MWNRADEAPMRHHAGRRTWFACQLSNVTIALCRKQF